MSTVMATSSLPAHATASHESKERTTTTTSEFTSISCMNQINDLASLAEQEKELYKNACSATITLTESTPEFVSAQEIINLDLPPIEEANMLESAKAGKIQSRTWTHTYWGGSIVEKHTGQTYYDGEKAWVKKYRNKTGSHTCQAAGSWAVGFNVTVQSCNKPATGSSATSTERFRVSFLVSGSPIHFVADLKYKVNANGATTAWQVGG